MLVLGRQDQMTSPKAVAPLVQALNAKVVHLPCGHSVMAEAPDALAAGGAAGAERLIALMLREHLGVVLKSGTPL